MRDDEGAVSDAQDLMVMVNNVDPVINNVILVPNDCREGNPIRIEVDAFDPGGLDDLLTYQFDFDNDGGRPQRYS